MFLEAKEGFGVSRCDSSERQGVETTNFCEHAKGTFQRDSQIVCRTAVVWAAGIVGLYKQLVFSNLPGVLAAPLGGEHAFVEGKEAANIACTGEIVRGPAEPVEDDGGGTRVA